MFLLGNAKIYILWKEMGWQLIQAYWDWGGAGKLSKISWVELDLSGSDQGERAKDRGAGNLPKISWVELDLSGSDYWKVGCI